MNQTTISAMNGLPAAAAVVSRARPAAIAGARDVARAFLDSLQLAVGPDTADTVVLVVSELVTNALRHAGGACVLQLTAHRTPSESLSVTPAHVHHACAFPT